MSIFLYYFEEKDPHADWTSFSRRSIQMYETFQKVNHSLLLNSEKTKIQIGSKVIDALLIYDGTSSDRIFFPYDRNDFQKKQALLDFIQERLGEKIVVPNLVLTMIPDKLSHGKKFDSILHESIGFHKLESLDIKQDVVYEVAQA